jgi:hypothetical protein
MKPVLLTFIGLMIMASAAVQAGSISCSGHTFEDGMQTLNPPHRDEIIAKCGDPDSKGRATLEYKQPGGESVKVLHFNSADELVFIDDHKL